MSLSSSFSLTVGNRHFKRLYGMPGEWKSFTPIIRDKPSNHFGDDFDNFGDKMWDPDNVRSISLSLLGVKLWRFFWNFLGTSYPVGKKYKYRSIQRGMNLPLEWECIWASLESFFFFLVLSSVRTGKLLDTERY
ncbi:hypothetical protein AVEN_261306-1 [Araneus ventricosus]|uniref:Uncharacterized protein n=1 Tax=Araneus ventricosus TaxID=182803 RepID=A0A4Y2SJQ0_ARAVE|nr:hypothetical protein AVEN_261306-1 [Araneus ventricosus]